MRTFAPKQKPNQQAESANHTGKLFTQNHAARSLLHLQRTIENHAVQRLLQTSTNELEGHSATGASTRLAHDFSRISLYMKAPAGIQPKLSVGRPNDICEEEADRVAEQVMCMPETHFQNCGGCCPECPKEQGGRNFTGIPDQMIQRHVRRPSSGPEFPRITGEHPELQNVTPLLRNLYRGIHYHPAFYWSYLFESLVVSEVRNIASVQQIRGITFYMTSSQNEVDNLELVAFSLLSSQMEIAAEMGRLPSETANRFQSILSLHMLVAAIDYVRGNPGLWPQVIQERQRRQRRRRRPSPPLIPEPPERRTRPREVLTKALPVLQSKRVQEGDARLVTAPSIVEEVLGSPGRSLDSETRLFMESRFGHDFSPVRVHTDARAAESARAVNALAYTAGKDIVFGAGRCDLSSSTGKRLLAHELVHVIQQDSQGGDLRDRQVQRLTLEELMEQSLGEVNPDQDFLDEALSTLQAEQKEEIRRIQRRLREPISQDEKMRLLLRMRELLRP